MSLFKPSTWFDAPARRPVAAPYQSRVQVRAYQVRLYCRCHGEMLRCEPSIFTAPGRYQYQCKECGAMENNNSQVYPYIQYEEVPRQRGTK